MLHYHDFGTACKLALQQAGLLLTKLSTACSGIKKGFSGKRLTQQVKNRSKERG